SEIEYVFRHPALLHDVRMRPLGWAIRRWWNRCEQSRTTSDADHSTVAGLARERPILMFLPNFEQRFEGRIAWCRRRRGVPFTPFERFVIRRSFTFRRVRE